MIAPSMNVPNPSTAAVDLTAKEVQQLVWLGFQGVLNGMPEAALRIFNSLDVVRPEESFPRIGIAVAQMSTGRADDAVRTLEEVARRRPDDEAARVFLGMALRMANRGRQADGVLTTLADRTDEGANTRLARQLIKLPL
jgi:thioredoxin-like negative regulator of GroEL